MRKLITLGLGLAFLSFGVACKSSKKMIDKTKDDSSQSTKVDPRKQAEELQRKLKEAMPNELSGLFNELATETNNERASQKIEMSLEMFSSPDAIVLLIINKSEGMVDYEKPTTIKHYLEYIKDTHKSLYKVDKIVWDGTKIQELELLKK